MKEKFDPVPSRARIFRVVLHVDTTPTYTIKVYEVDLDDPREKLQAQYDRAYKIVKDNPDLGLVMDPREIRVSIPTEDKLVIKEELEEELAKELLPNKYISLRNYDIYNQLVLVWIGHHGHYIRGIIANRGNRINWGELGEIFPPASSLEEDEKPLVSLYFEDILRNDPKCLGLYSDFDDHYSI